MKQFSHGGDRGTGSANHQPIKTDSAQEVGRWFQSKEELQCLNSTAQGNTKLDTILESCIHGSELHLKGMESREDLRDLCCFRQGFLRNHEKEGQAGGWAASSDAFSGGLAGRGDLIHLVLMTLQLIR